MVPCVAGLPGSRALTLLKSALMIQGMTVRPLPALIAQVSVSTWMDGQRLDAYLKVLLAGKAKVNRENFVDYLFASGFPS